jgi:hypothetical protein
VEVIWTFSGRIISRQFMYMSSFDDIILSPEMRFKILDEEPIEIILAFLR